VPTTKVPLGLTALALLPVAVVVVRLARVVVAVREASVTAVDIMDLGRLSVGTDTVSPPEGSRFIAVRLGLNPPVRQVSRYSATLVRRERALSGAVALADSLGPSAFYCDDSAMLLRRRGAVYAGTCRVKTAEDPFLDLPVRMRQEMTTAAPVFVFAVPAHVSLGTLTVIFRRLEAAMPLEIGSRVMGRNGIEVNVAQVEETPILTEQKILLVRLEVHNGSRNSFRLWRNSVGIVRSAGPSLGRRIWARVIDPWPVTEVDPALWIALPEAGLADVTVVEPGEEVSTQPVVTIPPGHRRSLVLPFLVGQQLSSSSFRLAVFSEEVLPLQ
jgi:hypothetical protein